MPPVDRTPAGGFLHLDKKEAAMGMWATRPVIEALPEIRDAVHAAVDLWRMYAWFSEEERLGKLRTLSDIAGTSYVNKGLAPDVDTGIVMYHQEIGKVAKGLGKVLYKNDVAAGRIKKPRVTPQQRLVRDAVKAGEVKRSKTGKILSYTPAVKRTLSVMKKKAAKVDAAKVKERQYRLKVRLGIRAKRRPRRT